jgi:hypothetical protein
MAEVSLKIETGSAGATPGRGVQEGQAVLRRRLMNPSQAPGSLTAEREKTRRVEGDTAAFGKLAPAKGLALRDPDTGEGPAFQVREEPPHFLRRGKHSLCRVTAHARPLEGPPLLGHGFGKEDGVKAEVDSARRAPVPNQAG